MRLKKRSTQKFFHLIGAALALLGVSLVSATAPASASGNGLDLKRGLTLKLETNFRIDQTELIPLLNGSQLALLLTRNTVTGQRLLSTVYLDASGNSKSTQTLLTEQTLSNFSLAIGDEGQVALLIYTDLGITLFQSPDGLTWSNPVIPVSCTSCSFNMSSVAFGSDDSLAILWRYVGSTYDAVMAASSVDGGHWSPPSILERSTGSDESWFESGMLSLRRVGNGFAAVFSSKTSEFFDVSTSYLKDATRPHWTQSKVLVADFKQRQPTESRHGFYWALRENGNVLNVVDFNATTGRWVNYSSSITCECDPSHTQGFVTSMGNVKTYLWQTEDGATHAARLKGGLLQKLPEFKSVEATAFSPFGLLFASLAADGSLAIGYAVENSSIPRIAILEEGRVVADSEIPTAGLEYYGAYASQGRDAKIFVTVLSLNLIDFADQLEIVTLNQASKPSVYGVAKVAGLASKGANLRGTIPIFKSRSAIEAVTQQWFECLAVNKIASNKLPSGCQAIKGATKITYKIPNTAKGRAYLFGVTARNVLGVTSTYSASTKIVR